MDTLNVIGTRFVVGEGLAPPVHDNENWPLLSEWMTPAEAVQLIHQEKERMRRRMAKDFALRSCPEFQRDWDVILGMEQIAHRLGYSER